MNDAIIVATHLRTRHESKKHGGYDVYEDDKIVIMYDTYFPNVSVYVKQFTTKDGVGVLDRILVYSKSGHGTVSVDRPGKWVEYLKGLIPAAIAAEAELAARRKAKEKADHDASFGPIDDSKVFIKGE